MSSEITKEDDENFSYCSLEGKIRIRQLIAYQKSLYFSSSSSSSSAYSSTYSSASTYSSRKSSHLLELMKEGSTSLGRLFDMEHTSLGNYFKDYSVSPIVKPILLWGSDNDDDDDDINHDDPWAQIKLIKSAFGSKIGCQENVQQKGESLVSSVHTPESHEERVHSIKGSFKDGEFVHHRKREKTRKRKLIRTKSHIRLPRLGFWRCGVFRFRLKLIRKIRVLIRGGRKL